MATRPVYWRNARKDRIRLLHIQHYFRILKWQAKRDRNRKSYLFLVQTGDTQYFVVVEA